MQGGEDKDYRWLGDLLGDEAVLRRAFRQVPDLANRLTKNVGFLDSLLAQREPLKALISAEILPAKPGAEEDFAGFDAFLEGHFPGDDGVALAHPGDRRPMRLVTLLANPDEADAMFRSHPELAALLAGNNAYREQLKVLRPEVYRALLDKAGEVFVRDAVMSGVLAAATAALPEEITFTTEGGKKLTDGEVLGEQLVEAARIGDTAAAQALLAAGADPNVQGNHGQTSLMYAAAYGCAVTVKALLANRRTDCNLQDNNGQTALMLAARNGETETVKVLIENGADSKVQDAQLHTAADLAAMYGHHVARALLIDAAKQSGPPSRSR